MPAHGVADQATIPEEGSGRPDLREVLVKPPRCQRFYVVDLA